MIPLPKKIIRREALVDDQVAAQVDKIMAVPWVLEVKIKGNTLIRHQRSALQQVANGTMKPYKIPDMGKRNPFDYVGGFKFFTPVVCVVDGKNVECGVYNKSYKFNFKIR